MMFVNFLFVVFFPPSLFRFSIVLIVVVILKKECTWQVKGHTNEN